MNWLLLHFLLFLMPILAFPMVETPGKLEGYSVSYLGIENGLSNNAVTAIYQDDKGFMWMGTYDGLNRFDGYDFLVFRNQPRDSSSLVHNRIVSIYGEKDAVWVGTKRGLSVYNYCTGEFESRDYIVPESGAKKRITANINKIVGNKETVIIATAGEGILRKSAHGTFNKIPLVYGNEWIYDFHAQGAVVDGQNIWVFVQGYGLAVSRDGDEQLSLVLEAVKSANCITLDNKNNLWIGSDYGVVRYGIGTQEWHLYPAELSRDKITGLMYVAEEEQVWVATDGNGLLILDVKDGEAYCLKEGSSSTDLSSNAIYGLTCDQNGRKWIGTLRGGINIVEKEQNRFTTVRNESGSPDGLVSDFILSLCEQPENKLWIGTDGGGVSLWDRETQEFRNFRHKNGDPESLPSDYVTAILKGDEGIWFATYGGGVSLYDSLNDKFVPYPLISGITNQQHYYIWVLFRDRDGTVWAATSNGTGLYRYNKSADRFDFVDVGVYGIIAMQQDHAGNYWVGTFDHLIKLDLNDKSRHQIINVGYPVRDILPLDTGELWVGTEGSGLWKYHTQSGRKKIYLQEEGLPNNSVLKLLQDDHGKVWISTYKGLACLDPKTEDFTTYFASDGLQSNQFNYNAGIKLHDGNLVFGGIRGFNIIKPDQIETKKGFPPLHLTELRVNNIPGHELRNSVFALNELVLPYDQSMLSLDFVALEYGHPDKIEYAYFMEGWDDKWHYVNNSRMANYSKLSEGEYIFHVKSTNAQGVWNQEVLSLPVSILPPWYRTWWAYTLYTLLLVSIGGVLLIYQRKQARLKYQVKLSNEMAQREKELNEKKMNFFTNISHEFRSPLTMIINPLKEVMYGERQQLDPGSLEVVYRNSKRLLSLVDQLLLFRKVQTEVGNIKMVKLDAISVCKEVFACFVHHARSREINYVFETGLSACTVYADRQKLEIALFNLISNALKFVEPERGKVTVTVSDNDEALLITVQDNGAGIKEEDRTKIFELFYQAEDQMTSKGFGIGLYLVKKLVEEHAGKVEVEDLSTGGVVFTIQLPKGKAHIPDGLVHEDLGEHLVFLEELLEGGHVPAATNLHDEDQLSPLNEEIVIARKKIVVVDDNPQIRDYIKKIFSPRYLVRLASGADEAFNLLEEEKVDLVISDVVMDGMNGVELCKSLKNHEDYKHIPVILLTASASDSIKLKGVEVGADDYITKPFDKTYLLARVKGILKQQETVQQHLLNTASQKANQKKLSRADKSFIDKMAALIEGNLDNEEFSIQRLAQEMGMSHSLMYRKVKEATGKTVNELIRFIRLRTVATILITTDAQVNEAVSSVGWNDMKYFRQQFSRQYGMTPTAFQKKYRGAVTERQYVLNEGFWKNPS